MPRGNMGKFIGTFPCTICQANGPHPRMVRVYDWLPEAVVCWEHKRDISAQERMMQAPADDEVKRPSDPDGHKEWD